LLFFDPKGLKQALCIKCLPVPVRTSTSTSIPVAQAHDPICHAMSSNAFPAVTVRRSRSLAQPRTRSAHSRQQASWESIHKCPTQPPPFWPVDGNGFWSEHVRVPDKTNRFRLNSSTSSVRAQFVVVWAPKKTSGLLGAEADRFYTADVPRSRRMAAARRRRRDLGTAAV
jgi:hypothetical protein